MVTIIIGNIRMLINKTKTYEVERDNIVSYLVTLCKDVTLDNGEIIKQGTNLEVAPTLNQGFENRVHAIVDGLIVIIHNDYILDVEVPIEGELCKYSFGDINKFGNVIFFLYCNNYYEGIYYHILYETTEGRYYLKIVNQDPSSIVKINDICRFHQEECERT